LTILAIETCTTHGSLSLVESASEIGERVLATSSWTRSSSHAEHLSLALEKSRDLLGGWSEIQALACGIGPGSFTGIRVGINTLRAVAWALENSPLGAIPFVGVRTTDTLLAAGRAALPHARVTALIPAQMNLCFASFDGTEPEALSLEQIVARLTEIDSRNPKENLVLGPARLDFEEFVRPLQLGFRRTSVATEFDWPQAVYVARRAAEQLRLEPIKTREALVQKFHWQLVQPLYLRGSGAEEKMSERA
jgi:tRNA threonylcarbamoyl adenosine modification protein YeaZ